LSTANTKEGQALTARQLQVISLVGQGLSNKEIANSLKISEGTVKQHIFVIFRVLNVSSRAKLAVLSPRIGIANNLKTKNIAAHKEANLGYSWRLIVAVAISIAEVEPADAAAVIERNNALEAFRSSLDEMVFALDGNSMRLPDGGLLIWFGHPTSHIDDADRAVMLVQAIQNRLANAKLSTLKLGCGIATQAEVVPADSKELLAVKVFQQALAIAKKSASLKMCLANTLTKRLCCASVPWIELRPTAAAQDQESLYAVSSEPAATHLNPRQWGDLVFLEEVFKSVKNGVGQWLSVESWPPSMANSLVDAVGVEAVGEGFFPIKLHIPSAKRRDALLSSLLAQVEGASAQIDLSSSKPDSTLDRLLSCLWKISTNAPVVLQVYGIQSLQTLKAALGDRGIDRLVGLKVLVVVTNVRDVKKHITSIRILGPRPDKALFTRMHTMQEPDIDLLPEGVLMDIQAIVDDLSAAAKQVIFAAAQSPDEAFDEKMPLVDLPRPVLQGALQELSNLGLIFPRDDHYFDFRDAMTANAISHLNKLAVNS
jgi:DNA-binding CsgD family transcriptional regulator